MRLILALISKNGIDMQAPHNKAFQLACKEGAFVPNETMLQSGVIAAISSSRDVMKYVRKVADNSKTKIRLCYHALYTDQTPWLDSAFEEELRNSLKDGNCPREHQWNSEDSFMQTAVEAVCVLIGAYSHNDSSDPMTFVNETSAMIESTAQEMLYDRLQQASESPPTSSDAWTAYLASRAKSRVDAIKISRRAFLEKEGAFLYFHSQRTRYFSTWRLLKKEKKKIEASEYIEEPDEASIVLKDW
eukprot:CAMPEP_0185018610 /NCGR_PEP_ID=MMETSP1103-20130426/1270_1 /TAXON_ID=36769 /ORGANISM="Paraphysomonas bandaiensis, Strain Caron Lab Isolate" /LENGTH=244 /DNA_ID=CAMNT_0027548473 /DNA_START=459 /DNA_END=1193 /DNA_ORIENTATION=-